MLIRRFNPSFFLRIGVYAYYMDCDERREFKTESEKTGIALIDRTVKMDSHPIKKSIPLVYSTKELH